MTVNGVFNAGMGAGLMLLNNLAQLVIALGGRPGSQAVFVSLFSVANCGGRLLFGYRGPCHAVLCRRAVNLSYGTSGLNERRSCSWLALDHMLCDCGFCRLAQSYAIRCMTKEGHEHLSLINLDHLLSHPF